MDSLKLNKEIAYKGKIGKQRAEFCIRYIKHKKLLLSRIQQKILAQIEESSEKLTCYKGCSFCCVLYIEANIQECEAIVYYLYQNHNTLSLFLQNYAEWREEMRRSGDIFKRCEQALHEKRNAEQNANNQQALADLLLFYKMQNIPCPFLHKEICTIYEVRPYTCANHYVTTPSHWCNPMNPKQPKVHKTTIEEEIFDLTFYIKNLYKPLILFMPLAVYEILNSGFSCLSNMTGFTELANVISDPEISAILEKNRHD